ncbi:phosphoenolpyruvate carboxykinase (GTP) [Microcella frigidaquae]|uniref:Phosphoenolpyruvate carboxykinase [GTP] n=1 Tax=Microcella frigidaquae TaxID=424758 RepID=A0A840X9A6_9MICO|nr:phosphoenolpyruvate carboxykinase (GTP) [Microcella frigidaquae]MBB5618811.1 phosphoenolpyruvate carboxykinase (GTP) [Microcella frigidaquae]NHN44241.1 phosphoenolpyruvate carboxykinase (GTP) [Microcella frigidaquae]
MTLLDRPRTTGPVPVVTPERVAVRPAEVQAWVTEQAALLEPADIVWVTGSTSERHELLQLLVANGTIEQLNPELRPYSFIARSAESDVARLESRTFICTDDPADAGPTNNWREPAAMRAELDGVFRGAMRGRTMYVVPFAMGPIGSPMARFGVQVTDSPYVVVSIGTMTRMGDAALEAIARGASWVPAVHSVGAPLAPGQEDVPWPCNDTKYIVHFPETREIWSYGSAYGGNAILAKKAYALRIASVMAREEGWLAEHMLLIKVTSPEGRSYHFAAAFPSACGKTNMAMMTPNLPGWTVETIGDDIAWLWIGADGRLRAINPEAGFFGVAPGTGLRTNPTAVSALWGNTIFTNVATTPEGDVWWEGLTDEKPARLTDWRGEEWTPASGRPAAHPNSRFTVSARQCPSIAEDWDDPEGVVIDAIIFGGRRASNVPLVVEARDWDHGVFMGATIASEQTAAAEGTVGELRRDPFAMLPFAGYNMADYFAHWLDFGRRLRRSARVPRVFQVNWFRKGADGSFLWPGFGDNARVLEWMVKRIDGQVGAIDSPIGSLPTAGGLNVEGVEVDEAALEELFRVDPEAFLAEADDAERFFASFGDRLPAELQRQLTLLRGRLEAART